MFTKAAAEGTAPAGRSKYSDPKARARHAALVRWKKENPQAANVAERLAQIRAARLKKKAGKGGKGKGKGKAAAKPKQTPEQRKQAKLTEQAQARETTLKGAGVSEDARYALDDLASGRGTDDDGGLEKMGLAERDADGNLRLTAAGRAAHRAAGRGDAAGVKDALSRAKERLGKKAERDKAKAERAQAKADRQKSRKAKRKAKPKAEKPAKPAPVERTKEREAPKGTAPKQAPADRGTSPRKPAPAPTKPAPAKPSGPPPAQRGTQIDRKQQPTRLERKMISGIVDDLLSLRDELTEEDAAIKAGRRNSSSDQAQIDQGYELAMQLCDLFESLGADTGEEEGEEEMGMEEEMGEMEMEGKAETFGGKKRDDLKDSDFAGPNRTYPIMTAADVKDAASLIGKADDPDAVKRKIIAIAKRKGFEDALPEAWKEATKKSLDGDLTTLLGGAVKMAGDDGVFGPAVWLNGSPDTPDLSRMRDYFTKSTEFWIDEWERRPMLWHHNLDESDILDAMRQDGASDDEVKAMAEALDYLDEHPVIGTWTKATIDPIAVWLKGQINKAHRYRGAVKQLIDSGLIKISTDSAPHLVKRQRQPNGTHEVKRWPIVAGSLTATAAEPRLFDVQAVKALYDAAGITLPFAIDTDNPEAQDQSDERPDGAKAAAEKARKLMLELDLLELEQVAL